MSSSIQTNPFNDDATQNRNVVYEPQPLIPRLIDHLVEKVTGKSKSLPDIALSEAKKNIAHSANVQFTDDHYSKDSLNKTPFEANRLYNNKIEKQSLANSSPANIKNHQTIFTMIETYPGIFKDLAHLVKNGDATDFYVKPKSSPITKNLKEESLGISEEIFNRSGLSTKDTALIYDISLAMNLAATKKTDVNLAKKIAVIATEKSNALGPIDLTDSVDQYLSFHTRKLAIAHIHAWNRSVEISLDNKDFKHPVDHAKKLTAKNLYLTPGGAWRDDLFQDADFMQRLDQRKDLKILNDPALWGTYFINEKTIPNLGRALSTADNKNLAALRLLTAVAEASINKGQTFSIDFKALDIDPNQLKQMGFDISKIDGVKIIDSSAHAAQIKQIHKSEANNQDALAQKTLNPSGMGDTLEKLFQAAQTGSHHDLAKGLKALSAESPAHASLALNEPPQPGIGLGKVR